MKCSYPVVGICGYGNSGASAIIDMFRGTDQLYVNDYEWQILHSADGILDLMHYIVDCQDKIASNTAIQRYKRSLYDYRYRSIQPDVRNEYRKLSEQYINDLIQCSWNGFSTMDGGDIVGFGGKQIGYLFYNNLRRAMKLIGIKAELPPSQKRYFSLMSKEEFINITGSYLDKLFEKMAYKTDKPLILEQLFVFSNPTLGHEFFSSAKTILVERDPRDVYASSKFSAKDGEPKRILRFMPTDSVQSFSTYFRRLHQSIATNENVLIVHFEDLIYNYESTAKEISEFIGIDYTEDYQKFFHPEISINNTKFFKKFPQIEEDINYITTNLKEYLNPYVD